MCSLVYFTFIHRLFRLNDNRRQANAFNYLCNYSENVWCACFRPHFSLNTHTHTGTAPHSLKQTSNKNKCPHAFDTRHGTVATMPTPPPPPQFAGNLMRLHFTLDSRPAFAKRVCYLFYFTFFFFFVGSLLAECRQ